MSTWVSVLDRVIICVSIPIKCLRFSNTRNHCVRLDKPAEQRIVEAGIVIHQAGGIHVLLESIAIIRLGDRAYVCPYLTKG